MSLAFLPTLPVRVALCIACTNGVMLTGHALGYMLDLWPFSHDVNTLGMIVGVMLVFTPTRGRFEGVPAPPQYDEQLSMLENMRAMLAYLEAYPQYGKAGREMVAKLREDIAELERREIANQ